MEKMTLGKRIKELREARGLTQAELAKKIGCSVGAVSAWEQDKREPKQEREALLNFFNTTWAKLFGAPEENLKPLAIPIVISAGHNKFEALQPPYENISFENCKAVIVQSDSMLPIAHKGQKIIYCEGVQVKNGNLVFVKLKTGEQFIKRFFKKAKTVILYPISAGDTQEPVMIDETEIDSLHNIVGVRF